MTIHLEDTRLLGDHFGHPVTVDHYCLENSGSSRVGLWCDECETWIVDMEEETR